MYSTFSAIFLNLLTTASRPLATLVAGSLLAGDYAGDGGVWGLLLAIWGDAGRGQLGAWILFLAPYLVVQLMRLSWALLRRSEAVTDITKNEKYQ